jgi:2-dehydro-3-deoxyphosphooctonate aldolase (KDO 8-P synthase)
MEQKTVALGGGIRFGNNLPLVLIAGNCVIEDRITAGNTAAELSRAAKRAGVPLVYKASYDKANRTSLDSFRGPGLSKGLDILRGIKRKYRLPLLVDVHCRADVGEVAGVADILQVPAFLCRQTDLILECARTGLPVNVKKGQFLAPSDAANIARKIESAGNRKIMFTERGTSFGYNNLVVDMRSIEIMKRTGYPVIFDATHSVQLPGGMGKTSGGQREFIPVLARAAAAAGVAGIFIEVHKNPSKALSDGGNSLALKDVPEFLKMVLKIDRLMKQGGK